MNHNMCEPVDFEYLSNDMSLSVPISNSFQLIFLVSCLFVKMIINVYLQSPCECHVFK